jgi:hypothetical protein
MTQMAGEKILGLLALAEQQNTDLQGKGGVVVDPFSDEPLIGMDLGGKTWEEQWMQKGKINLPKDFDKMDDATKKYILGTLFKRADASDSWNEGTGIEKGGFENAPPWLRDQLWKKDLEKRRELGLEPSV